MVAKRSEFAAKIKDKATFVNQSFELVRQLQQFNAVLERILATGLMALFNSKMWVFDTALVQAEPIKAFGSIVGKFS